MAIKLYNKAMERKLTSGQAIDLSRCPRKGDFYVLTKVVDGWTIATRKPSNGFGQSAAHRKTGEILASHTDELFNHRNFECLWLR